MLKFGNIYFPSESLRGMSQFRRRPRSPLSRNYICTAIFSSPL